MLNKEKNIGELKKANDNKYKKETKFNLPFSIEECFTQIIKLSFASLRSVNWRNITKYHVGDVLKGNNQMRYKITALEIPKLYQLTTELEKTIYETTFELKSLKVKKTQIIFSESFIIEKNLSGLRSNIGITSLFFLFELIFSEECFTNMDKFVDQYFEIIEKQNQNLKKLVKTDSITKFAQMILESDQIIICGMNINYNQSIDFKNKLISSGKNCVVEQDLHLLQALVNSNKKNKLVITISLSNENKDIIKLGKSSVLHNSRWIHITSKPAKYEFTPDLTIYISDTESEIWNLYSIRGGALFNLYNLVFANYIMFLKNEKK